MSNGVASLNSKRFCKPATLPSRAYWNTEELSGTTESMRNVKSHPACNRFISKNNSLPSQVVKYVTVCLGRVRFFPSYALSTPTSPVTVSVVWFSRYINCVSGGVWCSETAVWSLARGEVLGNPSVEMGRSFWNSLCICDRSSWNSRALNALTKSVNC